jgi:hypothetical protein
MDELEGTKVIHFSCKKNGGEWISFNNIDEIANFINDYESTPSVDERDKLSLFYITTSMNEYSYDHLLGCKFICKFNSDVFLKMLHCNIDYIKCDHFGISGYLPPSTTQLLDTILNN